MTSKWLNILVSASKTWVIVDLYVLMNSAVDSAVAPLWDPATDKNNTDPPYSLYTSSTIGAIAWQWEHQLSMNSRTMGLPPKDPSVMWSGVNPSPVTTGKGMAKISSEGVLPPPLDSGVVLPKKYRNVMIAPITRAIGITLIP